MSVRRALAACAVLLVALTCVVGAVGVARADDVADEADLQFKLGAEAYQKGDYKGALEHFLASNRLVANRNVEFNIARTYERCRSTPTPSGGTSARSRARATRPRGSASRGRSARCRRTSRC